MEAKKTSVAMAERARRWQLGKARRARAAARKPKAKASPKAKAKAKAILVVSSAGARASTPGAPTPAASSSTGGATASASSSGTRPASSSTASASTPDPVLFKFDTCLQTLESPNTAETLNWLTAVAHGGRVEVDGKRVTMTPGIRKAQRLDITNGFMLNHTRLYESLRSSMRAYGSKWKQRKDGDPGVRIGGRTDLIAFLLAVQRAAEC